MIDLHSPTARLTALRKWFSRFARSFYTSNEEDRKNISLKIRHTYKVCRNITEIAREERQGQTSIPVAEVIALLHDVGRFPQYAQYKTFNDRISVNHAELGARIITSKGLLKEFPSDEQEIITDAVKFHNAFAIPKLKNPEKEFFLKLIRDADKLDIWRVFIEYFESSETERASAAGIGLPELPGYSEEVFSYLLRKQVVPLSKVKSLNDYKLVQLSWIYDLHFRTSYALLLDRGYIKRIIAHLPQTESISRLSVFLQEFALSRIK
ncbi:MAG: HD domain-containing protein [Nitrospirota bacterium]|nr:HD domain-containing protein [Nitrospirota bacterium]